MVSSREVVVTSLFLTRADCICIRNPLSGIHYVMIPRYRAEANMADVNNWETMAKGLHADNEALRVELTELYLTVGKLKEKLERGYPSLQTSINRKHQQLLDARVERQDALVELSLAHAENKRIQQAYDRLMIQYEKVGDDFNNHYRQRW